jgi:hypothetical protein
MTVQIENTNVILSTVAQELHISEDELIKQGLRELLEHQLRDVKARIFEITGQYGISSVAEMDDRYKRGTLEESESWRDLHELDHLEYKRDRLVQILEAIP